MEAQRNSTLSASRTQRHQGTCQLLLSIMLMLSLLPASACSKRYGNFPAFSPVDITQRENHGVGRFKSAYLAQQIDEYYRGTNPGPIGIATFVNLDDLYTSSTFGRVYGEQLMSELAMRGFDVVELRQSDALQFLATSGEFALSRDTAMVRRARDLGGIVVGTYAVSPIRVYVNARLLDPATSVVLAAGSVEMNKTMEIARLLRGGTFPATLERIPVKHLGFQTIPAMGSGPMWHAEETPYLPAPAMVVPPAPAVPQSGIARKTAGN